jgi:signal transduction histidine kinase
MFGFFQRPWQIWVAAGSCLLLVVTALTWLTFKAIAADRVEQQSRQQAAIDQNARLALFWMDNRLATLIAEENSRPTHHYAATIRVSSIDTGNGANVKIPQNDQRIPANLLISPLLTEVNPIEVSCYFQIGVDGQITSPAVPAESYRTQLVPTCTTNECIADADQKLTQVRQLFQQHQVVKILSAQSKQLELSDQVSWSIDFNSTFTSTLSPSNTASYGNSANLSTLNANSLSSFSQLPTIDNNTQQQQFPTVPPANNFQSLTMNGAALNTTVDNAGNYIPAQGINLNPPSKSTTRYINPEQTSKVTRSSRGVSNANANVEPNAGHQPEAPVQQQADVSQSKRIEDFQQRASYLDAQPLERGNRSLSNEEPKNDYLSYAWAESQLLKGQPNQLRMGVQASRMFPLWLEKELILVRLVKVGDAQLWQGCLLNWNIMQSELRKLIAELLPNATLQPLQTQAATVPHALVSLPVELIPGPIPVDHTVSWSPLKWSLVIAWSSLGIAALAIAFVGQGTIALSERRAAFVSAVTHELRTPLTTFRMYAEMLAEGMVPDQQLQQNYCRTLHQEADRLSHLVENVLAYARLERGDPRTRQVTLSIHDLLSKTTDRLHTRTQQAGFELELDCTDELLNESITTDPGALEQIFFNLIDNACKYAATAADRRIILSVVKAGKFWQFDVRDFGAGISSTEVAKLFLPFRKSAAHAAITAPGVGLGLALCRRLAQALGGTLDYHAAEPGASFRLNLPCASG